MIVPVLATAIACGENAEPRCERIGSSSPATDVGIEIRGAAGVDRPVVIHDRDGVIVDELVTDASGKIRIATVPGDASVTVDLGPFEDFHSGHVRPTLVSYFGLTSGDSLVLGRPDTPRRPSGSAVVTLRFTEPTDVAVSSYDPSLGGNCGAIPAFAASGPGELREVALETDCLFEPGVAVLVALGADGHVVAGASVPFSVAAFGATTVDLGAWQSASEAVLSISGSSPGGAFDDEISTQLTGYLGDELVIRYSDQVIQPAPYAFQMPFVPSVYDRVGVEANLDHGEFRKILSQPVDLALEGWLPPIGGFELVDQRDGAPSLSWGHDYLEQVAVGSYSIGSTSFESIKRYAVRHDQGCDCKLPPLPSHYRDLIPQGDEGVEMIAGVSLFQSPDLGNAELVRVFDPLGSQLPDDVGIYSTFKGEHIFNPGHDPD